MTQFLNKIFIEIDRVDPLLHESVSQNEESIVSILTGTPHHVSMDIIHEEINYPLPNFNKLLQNADFIKSTIVHVHVHVGPQCIGSWNPFEKSQKAMTYLFCQKNVELCIQVPLSIGPKPTNDVETMHICGFCGLVFRFCHAGMIV